MKASKILLNIMSIICFIYGAVYCFSLVFIPVGIYCFIAGRRFSSKAEHINDYFSLDKNIFRNYVIFSCVACFPLGFISIIPYLLLTSNNVKVSTVNDSGFKYSNTSSAEVKVKPDDLSSEPNNSEEQEETLQEKKEKFMKLENFKEKGLITDDELEMARIQLFGKDKE